MEEPPVIVKGKSEPSSAVNTESSSAATLTFAQALQTIEQPDVRIPEWQHQHDGLRALSISVIPTLDLYVIIGERGEL